VTPVAWELNFYPGELRRTSVPAAGGAARVYWYFPYRVVNNTGQDLDFLPHVERVGEIDSEAPPQIAASQPERGARMFVEPAIVGLDSAVFRAIRQSHPRSHPFLVEPVQAIGRLLHGADNARESVIVFGDLDPRVNRFTIYVGGLSGERQAVSNPGFDARKPAGEKNPRQFVLQKTLAMPYTLPGDPNTRRNAIPVLGRMDWVMR